MKRKLLAFLLLGLFAITSAMAQNRTITGKVVAAEDGLPLPGVSVRVKGGTIGTITSSDGNYSINVGANAKALTFNYLGYTATDVSIGNSNRIDVSLRSDAQQLTEVVVTSYGVQQSRKDIGGAVANVTSKEIQNLPVFGFDRAVQGKMAGVQVAGNSGIPGGAVSVRIRGTGSINAGNSPLYIIDGVQVNSGDLSRSLTSSNILNQLNPNDIESIDVLKDAAASSIYGAQGANGVVLITTKKGKPGKTQIEFSSYGGIAQATNRLDVLTGPEWLTVMTEAYTNRFGATGVNTVNFKNLYGADPSAAPTYSWYDATYRQGTTQNYEINARGGDAKTKFYISTGYYDQKGQQIKQDFSRGTLKVNLDHVASKLLSFESGLNLSTITQNGTQGGSQFGNPAFGANFIVPTNRIYNPDGSFNEPLLGTLPTNPLKSANYDINKGVTNQLVGNAAANFNIIKGLRFRSQFSLDYSNIKEDRYQDPRTQDGASVNGRGSALDSELKNWQTTQTLNYSNIFNTVHKVAMLVGYEYRNQVQTGITATGVGFPNYLFRSIASAATPTTTSATFTQYKTNGVFGRADYSYDDKYIASATLRYDGNSRFGAKNQFGYFPAGSLAWRVSKENFMKSTNNWLDDLKLRGSYGLTGNASIGNFDSRALYGSTSGYQGLAGITPGGLANDNLTWEENESMNVGADVSLFNNRIGFNVDYYIRKTNKLLLDKPLPNTSGYATIRDNIGKLQNKGLELELNTQNVKGAFSWTTNVNFSFNENKVTELVDGAAVLPGNTSIRVGSPVTAVFSRRYAGVNPADGRPMWYDVNKNITYNPLNPTDFAVLGQADPSKFGGLTNNFSYKGVSLNVFFQGQFDFLLFDQNKNFIDSYGFIANMSTDVNRRWTAPGQITDVPRAYQGGIDVGNSQAYSAASSRWWKDASYVRLKELTLAYDLPATLIGKASLSNARVYVQGTNLMTWTKYDGLDPEVVGTDNGVTPQAKTFTFGLRVGF